MTEPFLWVVEIKLNNYLNVWEPDTYQLCFFESNAKLYLEQQKAKHPENQYRLVKYIREPQP